MKKIINVIAVCMVFIVTQVVPKQMSAKVTSNKSKDVIKKKCNNLICLFDSQEDEYLFGWNHAVAYQLMIALQEKVAPIIVTANLMQHFCYWKSHRLATLGHFGPIFFIQKLLFTNLNGWDCYFHKRAGLVLLMPKTYIESHAIKQGDDAQDPLKQCGFDASNLDEIKDVSYAKILDYIEKHKADYSKIIDDFESMFVKNSMHDSSTISTWNIYMVGHGGAASTITTKKRDEQHIVNSIRQLESRVQAIKRGEMNVYEEELIRDEKELKKLLRQLKQMRSQGLSWKTGEFNIAGLLYEDFIQLMTFFEQGIKTSYVHYTTCFSGGFNQTLLNQELTALDVNFIVSAQGINEDVTYGVIKEQFAAFFSKLETLMCGAIIESVKDQEFMDRLIKDSIADVLESVIYRPYLDYTQPFVRIPSLGVFKALDMAKEVKLLTNSVAKAHQAEGSPIDYTEPSIKTIIVYPSYVAAPLKIKDHVAIVSPAPQTLQETQKPTVHIFEKVFYQDNLFSIIPNFVLFNTRHHRIIFVIKELHCLDSQHLSLGAGEGKSVIIKDLILQISPGQYTDVSVDIMFNYNAHNYSISKDVRAIRWNKERLFHDFKKGKPERIKDEDFIKLVEKIIGKSGIAILERKNKEIILPSMIEYFEGQIGAGLRAEKKENVQYPVLLKKLKKIERITSDVGLKLQKELVTKTESMPNLSWVHRLERLMSISRDILDYINKLLISEKDNVVILSYKARIESILKMLTQEYESAIIQLSWKEWSVMNVEPISKKAQEIRDDMADRIEQLRRYIMREEDLLKRGYGKPR